MRSVRRGSPSVLALSLALSLAGLAGSSFAQQPPPAGADRPTLELKDGRARDVVLAIEGEITDVDVANRIVSIKGPKGNVGDLRVDPAVRNLDQVKVGDRLRLTYRLGVAMALVKGGDGIREKIESEGQARAAKGSKPGGGVIKTTTYVANVTAVNAKRKTVTLQGPGGQIVDVVVQDAAAFKDVKVGDQVAANVTESVVLRVRTPRTPAKP